MESAVVTNIQGYSIHDGPGIRTAVFLKGCPLRCRWCANPENLSPVAQVGFVEKLCTRCGRCFGACENYAIRNANYDSIRDNPDAYRIDREKCNGCGECIKRCFYGALVRYGETMTTDEVFQKTRRDKMFYDSSGGGVTVSGGEPLLYPRFVAELFEALHGDGINTCVETCGHVPWQAFEAVLPVTDYFLFDLKHMDDTRHREYTGAGNALILENAVRLVKSGADVLFRQPLIPGFNDADEHIGETARFLLDISAPRLQIMPYHRMGVSKYDALFMPYGMHNMTFGMGDLAPMDAAAVEAVRTAFISHGIDCTVSK